jgi:hypothetical protein
MEGLKEIEELKREAVEEAVRYEGKEKARRNRKATAAREEQSRWRTRKRR